jgi:hypothetical protein
MTVTINGTSGITTPGVNSTASNTLGDAVGDTLNVGNGTIVTDSSGNVGIGTSSPSSFYSEARQLVVGSGSGGQGITIYAGTASQSRLMFADGTSGSDIYTGFVQYDHSSNALAFGTNGGTERMRIDSSGNLLVGTTSAIAKFFVSGAGTPLTAIHNSGGTSGYYSMMQFRNNANDGEVGSIVRVNDSSVAYNTSSDYRLKENIQPMQNALGVVAQLNPVTYTWKADGSDGQGFIAHELQAIVPDCVTGEKDAVDAEGKPVYQGIDTSFLVATLTKAIQELSAKNDALEARLTAAEEQILALGVK